MINTLRIDTFEMEVDSQSIFFHSFLKLVLRIEQSLHWKMKSLVMDIAKSVEVS